MCQGRRRAESINSSAAVKESEKTVSAWVKQKVKITNKNTIAMLKCLVVELEVVQEFFQN